MTMSRTEAREARSRIAPRWLLYPGKGAPNGASIEEAVSAIEAVAEAVRTAKQRVGHAFKPPTPEVRFAGPPAGAHGPAGWSVVLRVPAFVSERDVRVAAGLAGAERPAARRVRLGVLGTSEGAADHRTDRTSTEAQRIRAGRLPQHRARELR